MKKTSGKIIYVVSLVNKSYGFEWLADALKKKSYDLVFILLNPGNTSLEEYLVSNKIKVYRVYYSRKKDFLSAFLKVFKILLKEKPDIVHCHLFEANLIGLATARLLGIKKRVYTRHHSTLHHYYYPNGVKYDKLVNWLSTDIIAISQIVKEVLISMDKADKKKIHMVPHGFNLDFFEFIDADRLEKFRLKYKIKPNKKPIIGVISRYVDWKGIQYIIPAFKKFLENYPDSFLILANAQGLYKNHIEYLLKQLPQGSYVEIEFEEDLLALYKSFDMFIHVPVDEHSEAFGQIYVEALAAGVPSVFTLSGISKEFIKDKENALVVDFKNSYQIYEALMQLMQNEFLRTKLITNGKLSVKNFSMDKYVSELIKVYES
jgi:glycosyltransferase involved in cell wall biosynthesis